MTPRECLSWVKHSSRKENCTFSSKEKRRIRSKNDERDLQRLSKDSKIKEDLRNSFGGDKRREARYLGKRTGKINQDASVLHSSHSRGAIRKSR